MKQETSADRANNKENPYNTFGKDHFTNANTGQEIRMVTENWDYPLAHGVAFTSEVDKEDNYYKYIRHLPEEIIIDDLPLEMFGEDARLIALYYKKPYLVQSIFLASFPKETLEFLVKKYN